jgi:hypothetical protein
VKKTTIDGGVVAELDGKYWGILDDDGKSRTWGFGGIETAKIGNPEF